MRITGGEARGRSIASPQGREARPTASKIRQAFFNILSKKVSGARFLDLCAGTGLMGIEALSRGAKSLVAVEESRKLVKNIEANLKMLGYEGEVVCGDVRKVLHFLKGEKFDIIFVDPPYQSQLVPSILTGIHRFQLLAESGVVAIEHAQGLVFPDETYELVICDYREYGQSAITFFHRQE